MSATPKSNRLPWLVEPRKLAIQGASLEGVVPTGKMVRLQAAVLALEESARTELVFSQDENRHCVVEGNVSLQVDMQCQRCMQPVGVKLKGSLHLGVVWDDERAAVLPRALDPWQVAGEKADLYELVEDELLLAMPIVAYHSEDACQASGEFSTGEHKEKGDNPFNILAQLKSKL